MASSPAARPAATSVEGFKSAKPGAGSVGAAAQLPPEASLLRIVAQGLVPATAGADPVEAVAKLLAVQGQQASAIPHALLARTQGTSKAEVEGAFGPTGLVRSWPMRGTVHVTTAADHHWLRETLRHRDTYVRNHLKNLGLPPRFMERAADVALAVIANGAARREDLNAAWLEAGLLPQSGGQEADDGQVLRRVVFIALHLEGVLVQAQRSSGEHLVIDARGLPGAHTGVGGSGGVAAGQAGHAQALAEVARRYAAGHGPVTAVDLARWSALPLRQCAQALDDAFAAASQGDLPLARVRVENGKLVEFTPRSAAELNQAHYLRADLPDLLAQHREEANRTLFLGAFDELHVGYKDRTCLTDEAGERLICPAKNGVFAPLVVDRGRVVAVRPSAGLKWAGGAAASARVEKDADRAIKQMLARLG
ncbi:DNA glycosylase AlkZ-like family protein [Buchananella felis]|uniref:DNA glycosylase AlkZ-like family protein n=1 Tax=Buchananella felis TaxID=3231492 RepID=UPI0035270325